MATLTVRFEVNEATIRLLGGHNGSGQVEASNTTGHKDAVLRAVAQEFAENGTTSGTVTVTAS